MNKKFSPEEMKEREKQLIRVIALGYGNKQMAETLGWTIDQVINTRKKLYARLQLHDSREMTIYAVAVGIVTCAEVMETIVVIPL